MVNLTALIYSRAIHFHSFSFLVTNLIAPLPWVVMYPPCFAYNGGTEGNLSLNRVPFGIYLCREIGHLKILLENNVLPLETPMVYKRCL